jgi:hypothetical protein
MRRKNYQFVSWYRKQITSMFHLQFDFVSKHAPFPLNFRLNIKWKVQLPLLTPVHQTVIMEMSRQSMIVNWKEAKNALLALNESRVTRVQLNFGCLYSHCVPSLSCSWSFEDWCWIDLWETSCRDDNITSETSDSLPRIPWWWCHEVILSVWRPVSANQVGSLFR